MAVPNIFGSATAAIPLSQLDTNFATPVTIGNTAVQLGNTVTSFGNVTLTNVTISSGNVTVTGANVSGTANVSTLAVTGEATVVANVTASAFTSTSTFGFKNRIINGAMVIDQRNAGASVTITNTSASTYLLDRWKADVSQASKMSVQQSSTAPTGFTNSLAVTSLSAYTVGASEVFAITQIVEGFNIADFAWGTASAATVTLSFWVRSSLTGTFGIVLENSGNSRSYPATYTISAANTWEQKTVTVAGETSGTWVTNSGKGVQVKFGLGVGSTLSGTAGAWAAADYWGATGATSVVGTNGATFYITGVQLEKGSTATSFDYRPYGTEFSLCERYFQKCDTWFGAANSSTQFLGQFSVRTTMRTSPSISGTGAVSITNYYTTDFTQSSFSSSIIASGGGGTSIVAFLNNFTSLPVTAGYFLAGNRATNSNYVTLSAEL
jgi:hypothetical protein